MMNDFVALVDAIAKRPAMYVGKCSLHAVSVFLDGYDRAVHDVGTTTPPLSGWFRWVESRFLISHPAWHWSRILLHVYGTDQAAIEALPTLYREFLSTRAAFGVEGIEAELRLRLIAKYGRDYYEPPATHTNPIGIDGPRPEIAKDVTRSRGVRGEEQS
jgi:hypothetical protein